MSKPVMQDLFTFSGRRNRKSYFLYGIVLIAIGVVASIFVTILLAAVPPLGMLLAIGVFVPIFISSCAVGAQRCRDFGWTGWAILLTVIPYLGFLAAIIFMVIPGTLGDNRYGPDPLENPQPIPVSN